MAQKIGIIALGTIIAASAASASQPDLTPVNVAPAGTPTTRYCMRVEAPTGTRIESVLCWTRDEWAEQGVDVDKDWAKEGVAVLDA